MHGCGLGSDALVNAEVDSMGGVVDGGVGVGLKTSPRRVAIEKAQAELRQEYDVREERRRELEFLEKGGNPLDFKFGNAASLSVQSTSLTNHHAEHFVNSEAKGSFALTASPRGDSVESIGRPGAPALCEPNTADNFDGENQLLQAEKKSKQSSRRSTAAPSEQSGRMGGAQHAKESEDSAIFRPYARRNRSRPNRDGNRSSSHDAVKGFMFETNDQKNHSNLSLCVPKFPTSNGDSVPRGETTNTHSNMEKDRAVNEVKSPTGNFVGDLSDKTESNFVTEKQDKPFETVSQKVSLGIVSSEGIVASAEYPPAEAIGGAETKVVSAQPNGFEDQTDGNEVVDIIVAVGTKDSESSCSPKNQGLEVTDLGMNAGTGDENVSIEKQTSDIERSRDVVLGDVGNKDGDSRTPDVHFLSNECAPVSQNHSVSSPINRIGEEVKSSDLSIDGKGVANREKTVQHNSLPSEVSKSSDDLNARSTSMPRASMDDPDKVLKMANRAHEDSILEEARTIKAKHKRIAELSVLSASYESRRKSHWDFVLEEMAWLANDFAQERLWKMTATAQICHRAALAARLRFSEQNQHGELKRVAYTLAKAVMEFWHSAQTLVNDDKKFSAVRNCKRDSKGSDDVELSNKFGELDKEKFNELERQHSCKASTHAIQAYAARFLTYNCSSVSLPQAEAPLTPDRVADSIASEVSWDDHLTEESLFYAIPSGAMLTYRRSIESHLVLTEKTGSSLQEEVDTSVHDLAADIYYADNLYNEEEGENSTYPDGKSAKHDQKKQTSFTRTFSSRSYEPVSEMPFVHCNIGSQQNVTLGKRPPNNYAVGPVPPKRSRTASRQRVVGPVNHGVNGALQAPLKTDASSGDTSSFQDDQSTLHYGSQLQKSVEVESVGDFDKQLPYDCTETTKPRKKKKSKHLGSSYEQGWQLDSVIPNDQRDSSKKRLEGHHFDSNGSSGFYGPPPSTKRPKVAKQPMDGTLENMAPLVGSVPSPAASQMSNMSNTNKFIKIFNGRERGRKSKSFKISAAHSGPGSPWSIFEDQALVVLVHDMGPNWELVSDAINNTLQFKCIFRKPKECKERHKFLMDKGAGDGADSAEDSGSSQSYPSTLPGIPKGSARQLFQRLQGPMEEDTLKSHFEKIIMIGKKQHFARNQNDHLDGKQPVPPHNSHVIALSQVCPNNLNGGILTPLDLCDASPASADVHHIGYQGSHGNNLGMPNQGSVAPVLPTSAANALLQGTSGVVTGNNSPSPSVPVNPSVSIPRDSRYNPRTPLPVEEQRLQQMLSARGLPQPSMSASGHLTGADRGVRMPSGGNGMGMMPGVNRNMPIPRPGLQGMTSSPMLNAGNLIPTTVAGVQNPVNSHSGSVADSGNSMMRSRNALHIMRPGNNVEHQKQMISPEHQMQSTSGNGQGMPSFTGISSAYGNQTIPPPGPTFPSHQPHHHQMSPQQSHGLSSPLHPHLQGPNHTPGSQQHAYAMHRLAKERQLNQQRFAQQQQLAASGALVPHVQAPSQIPVSSSMPNSNQIPLKPSPQAVSAAPSTLSTPMNPVSVPQQQKHNLPHHGPGRTMQAGASLTNQAGKQRQRQLAQQQLQQSGRHQPQQRQHSQLLQNSRVSKGIGRGNMIAHQNLAIDHSHPNGLSLPQGNQVSEKGEQSMHLIPGQGMFPGPGLGGVQTSRSAVASSSNHSQLPQSQNQALPVTSSLALPSSHQAAPLPSMASNLQHLQTKHHQKQTSQSHPNVQRIVQPSHQTKSDMLTKSHNNQGHSDQSLTSDIPKASTGTSALIPQACSDSITTAVPVSPTAQRWNLPDTVVSNSATQPISGPLTHSGGTEAVVAVSQGLGQRQLSGGLPQHEDGALMKVVQSQQLIHPQEQPPQQEHQSPQK